MLIKQPHHDAPDQTRHDPEAVLLLEELILRGFNLSLRKVFIVEELYQSYGDPTKEI